MGAGAVVGHSAVHPEPGPSTNQELPRSNMSCANCAVNFTFFKRKKSCQDCGRHLCSSCLVKVASSPVRLRCKKCNNLHRGHFTRSDVADMQIKELRFFLNKNNVATHMCKEKDDLVELVFRNFGSATYREAQEEHQQYVNLLRERRAQDEQAHTPSQSPSQQRAATAATETHQQSQDSGPSSSDTDQSVRSSDSSQQQPQQAAEEVQEPVRRRASLKDVKIPEDVETLTVRELKEILARHFVDYKGCCERWELEDRVKRLWKENTINQKKEANSGDDQDDMCKVCMDSVIDCVLLECGHMVACTQCGKRLSECPVCRQYVVRAVHVFRS